MGNFQLILLLSLFHVGFIVKFIIVMYRYAFLFEGSLYNLLIGKVR